MRPERAITLRPCWAWAVAHAGKRIENRSWATKFRGPIYIHAGSGAPNDDERDLLAGCLRRARLTYPDEAAFARGALIATATVTDCTQLGRDELGAWGLEGFWHFLLKDVRPLSRQIPTGGKLGIWRV